MSARRYILGLSLDAPRNQKEQEAEFLGVPGHSPPGKQNEVSHFLLPVNLFNPSSQKPCGPHLLCGLGRAPTSVGMDSMTAGQSSGVKTAYTRKTLKKNVFPCYLYHCPALKLLPLASLHNILHTHYVGTGLWGRGGVEKALL